MSTTLCHRWCTKDTAVPLPSVQSSPDTWNISLSPTFIHTHICTHCQVSQMHLSYTALFKIHITTQRIVEKFTPTCGIQSLVDCNILWSAWHGHLLSAPAMASHCTSLSPLHYSTIPQLKSTAAHYLCTHHTRGGIYVHCLVMQNATHKWAWKPKGAKLGTSLRQ